MFRILSLLLVFSEFSGSTNGVFESTNYWEVIDKPVMSNGHIGFVPYGESVYMNGLYTGREDNSHRARIPNYANIQFEPCSRASKVYSNGSGTCSYALDIFNGVFRTQTNSRDGLFTVEQIQYVHRYFETAIVNHIRLERGVVSDGRANGKVHFSPNRIRFKSYLIIFRNASAVLINFKSNQR